MTSCHDYDHPHQRKPGLAALSFCAFGICACFIYYGMLQERLFSEHHLGATFVLLVQCAANTVVAYLWQKVDELFFSSSKRRMSNGEMMEDDDDDVDMKHGKKKKIEEDENVTEEKLDHKLFLLTSSCYVAAMTCSNEALQFVSYPTAVLAKSCKLIPTMAMGVFVERKRYQPKEWMAAFFITLGIVLFNLSRVRSKNNTNDEPGNSWIGMTLLFVSLCMDGLLGSCQGLLKQSRLQRQRRRHSNDVVVTYFRPPTAVETMLWINVYAMLFLLPLSLYTKQWHKGIDMLLGKTQVEDVVFGMLMLNMAVSLGQIFIFITITWFSPLVCTTITTTRKFFTILFSVLYFGHHFSNFQWVSVFSVFSGLYLAIVTQQEKATTSSVKKLTKQD